METFEQNPFETNRAEGGLRTLLIFTIVFQALGLLFGLLGLLQVSTQTGFTQASTIITPLLNLEMLIAAILMLNLKKLGWTLYLGAKGLHAYFFGADAGFRSRRTNPPGANAIGSNLARHGQVGPHDFLHFDRFCGSGQIAFSSPFGKTSASV